MRRPIRFAIFLTLSAAFAAASPHEEAAALIARGEFMAAERIVEPLARVKKPDAVSLHQLSQIRLGQQQFEESIRLAERAIKLDPTRPDYHSQLGLALTQQLAEQPGSYALDRIRKEMEQALKLDPRHLPALLALARYHAIAAPGHTPNFKLAEEYARRAAEVDRYEGEIELGQIDLQLRQTASALAHFDQALLARPGDATAEYISANILIQLGRKDEARTRLQAAIRHKPNFRDAQETLQTLDKPAEKPGS